MTRLQSGEARAGRGYRKKKARVTVAGPAIATVIVGECRLPGSRDSGRRRLTRFPHVARGLTFQRCVAAAFPKTVERDLIGAWLLPLVRSVRSPVAPQR